MFNVVCIWAPPGRVAVIVAFCAPDETAAVNTTYWPVGGCSCEFVVETNVPALLGDTLQDVDPDMAAGREFERPKSTTSPMPMVCLHWHGVEVVSLIGVSS